MLKILNTLQEKHKQEILKELEIVFYRFHRYHNHYSIALFYISKSIGASSKLLSQLKKSYNESVYSVIEDCRGDNEGSITLHNLFNLLDFSMKKNYDNEVIDKSYLDRIY